jgi:hypothetical protein
MYISAEVRLFWKGEPSGFGTWFRNETIHGCSAGGGSVSRRDVYLLDPKQNELGIKLRGSKNIVEVKGLVAVLDEALQIDTIAISPEIWSKWSSESVILDAAKSFVTVKTRWLRRFSTEATEPREIALGPDELPLREEQHPSMGCNVELTQITGSVSEEWWSLGFESFGSLETVATSLRQTVQVFLPRPARREISGCLTCSYPAWLAKYAIHSTSGLSRH